MSKLLEDATRIAGAAFEDALNSLHSAELQVEVVEMFVVIGSNFLRATQGEEYTRRFLQNGIDMLDHPAVTNVIHVETVNPGTKH